MVEPAARGMFLNETTVQWLGISVGDWATWIGVFVSVGVVIATWRAATSALSISTRDSEVRAEAQRGAARVAAAFLHPDVVMLVAHMNILKEQAELISQTKQGIGIHSEVSKARFALDLARPIFERLSLERIALLPHNVGAELASVVGAMPLECDRVEASVNCLTLLQKTIEDTRVEMTGYAEAIGLRLNGFKSFLNYFNAEFPQANAHPKFEGGKPGADQGNNSGEVKKSMWHDWEGFENQISPVVVARIFYAIVGMLVFLAAIYVVRGAPHETGEYLSYVFPIVAAILAGMTVYEKNMDGRLLLLSILFLFLGLDAFIGIHTLPHIAVLLTNGGAVLFLFGWLICSWRSAFKQLKQQPSYVGADLLLKRNLFSQTGVPYFASLAFLYVVFGIACAYYVRNYDCMRPYVLGAQAMPKDCNIRRWAIPDVIEILWPYRDAWALLMRFRE